MKTYEKVKGRKARRFSPTLKKKSAIAGRRPLPLPQQSYSTYDCEWAFNTAPIGCMKRLAARTYKSMKETTDLNVELEYSSVFDGNGIRPFWHVYCLEDLLIEDVRDG